MRSVTAETPDFIRTTRTSSDMIADNYTAQFSDHLADSSLKRSLLGAFAEMVGGDVADQPVGVFVAFGSAGAISGSSR